VAVALKAPAEIDLEVRSFAAVEDVVHVPERHRRGGALRLCGRRAGADGDRDAGDAESAPY
jgi:hypothetical protein